MFERAQIREHGLAINTGGAVKYEFYFPRDVRIKRYFDTPSVSQAAHSTIVVDAVFTNKGTDGLGSTVLATLTNDSDLADTTTRKSSAWVAADAKEIVTEARPGTPTYDDNVADLVAAGSVVEVVVTGAGSTPTASVHFVGIEYVLSD